ncbi:MAG: prepilin-type N-terminal cleavage/methylation domain-containing protein [Lentisphaeria bacterium]|nr:prepilin-type N-terminal cleavage/methylation domain-containing protein [Lentisphaeria bacterium]
MPRPLSRDNSARKCFTLVELLVVIGILAILFALTIPQMNRFTRRSKYVACLSNLRQLGVALQFYRQDCSRYPPTGLDSLQKFLADKRCMDGEKGTLRCPREPEGQRAYTLGYLGGHPSFLRGNDALIVCGRHPTRGTLAVLVDGRALIYRISTDGQGGGATVPITLQFGDEEVEPGFTLHNGSALKITSATGEEMLLYGNNGAHYIAASYDPAANDGEGAFSIILGFDDDSTGGQSARSVSDSYVSVITALEYSKVQMTSNPADSGGVCKLKWIPTGGASNKIELDNYSSYRVTHLSRPIMLEEDRAGSRKQFDSSADLVEAR